MNRRRILLKGSVTRTVSLFLHVLVGFIMTPFIVHSLGNRMFGFWSLVGTLIGYYGIFELGLSSAVNRFLSKALSNNDISEMNSVINTSLVLFTILAIISLLVSIIAALSSALFIENTAEIELFRKVIIILGLSVALSFPMKVFIGVLESYLRYDLYTYSMLFRLFLSNILIYYFLEVGYGILALTFINLFASIVQYIIIFILSKRIFLKIQISFSLCSKDKIKLLFSYSYKTLIARLADQLRFRLDNFIIAGFLGLSFVTLYSIGVKLLNYFFNLVGSMIGILTPVFSQYEAKGDYPLIKRRFLETTKYSVIISFFVGSSLIFYGKSFIHCWMGPDFSPSYYIMIILCVPMIFDLMQSPSIQLLYGISKHKLYSITNTLEGLLNLMLSLILVKFYGIYGVAIATAISMIIFKLFIQPYFVCKSINLSLKHYINNILSTTLKTLIPLFTYFFIFRLFLKNQYFFIFIGFLIQIIIFIPIVLFFILDKKERSDVLLSLKI